MNDNLLKKVGQTVAAFALATILILFNPGNVRSDPLVIADAGITANTIVVLPNHSTYRVAGGGQERAPFGSGGGCPIQKSVKSPWPVGTTIELRQRFMVPAGSTNFRVQLSIDNDADVFLNGTHIGFVTHEGCPLVDELLISDTVGALLPGANRIRVVAIDRGDESFFDLRALVDVP